MLVWVKHTDNFIIIILLYCALHNITQLACCQLINSFISIVYKEKPDSMDGYHTGIVHEFATTKHIDQIGL